MIRQRQEQGYSGKEVYLFTSPLYYAYNEGHHVNYLGMVLVFEEWMDGLLSILCPLQHYFNHISLMGR